MRDSKKIGIIISYINLALNMVVSVFFTPFLISSLGQVEYGVYRVVNSFAGQLSIMTFGMSTLVTRNIAFFDVKKDKKAKENFLAMGLAITLFLSAVAAIVGVVMYNNTGVIFKNSFTAEEIVTAKRLLLFMVANVAVIIINDFFAGFLTGHECFAYSNGAKTVSLILRILTLVVLLKAGFKSVAIVATDFGLSLALLLFDMFYGLVVLNEKIKFHYFDKIMFKSSLLFSSAILLQAIINQVNQNMDNLILGIMTEASVVTVYSIGLVIYSTYNSIPTVISSVFTPKATKMVAQNKGNDELTDFVSSVGRYQLMFAGAILSGFILFGMEFIGLWLGEGYEAVYKITLVLIVPVTIPLVQNVCNSILDAQMKRMSRSVVLFVMAIVNVVVSVILVKKIGYIGAAYGTSFATVVGHVVIMNVYYHKCIKLNVIKMFKDIFHRILAVIAGVTLLCIPVRAINIHAFPWISFLLKCALFSVIYSAIMYIAGMNVSEKSMFKNMFKKFSNIFIREK